MIDAQKLAFALALIATGEVPLGQYGETIQAVQAFADKTLYDQGIEPDPDEIATWPRTLSTRSTYPTESPR